MSGRQMTEQEQHSLDEVRRTLRNETWRLEVTPTFGFGGAALRLSVKPNGSRSFRKVGPLLFPPEGGAMSDLLRTLAGLLDQDAS